MTETRPHDVAAEVRQVGVAAQLGDQAGRGRVLQVGGHDLGRATVEGERRDHHPAMADWYQVRFTGAVLLIQQGDRVGAVRGGLPIPYDSTAASACGHHRPWLRAPDARIIDRVHGHRAPSRRQRDSGWLANRCPILSV
jgi:hypothetical protein